MLAGASSAYLHASEVQCSSIEHLSVCIVVQCCLLTHCAVLLVNALYTRHHSAHSLTHCLSITLLNVYVHTTATTAPTALLLQLQGLADNAPVLGIRDLDCHGRASTGVTRPTGCLPQGASLYQGVPGQQDW
jgi:hypothetical protein